MFKLALGHVLGIARNPAFGATKRDIHNCTFPCHPGSQCLNLIERYLRVITKAALRGPAHRAVLHAVSLEAVNVPIVHAHRDGHGENALGILDHLARIVVEAQNSAAASKFSSASS